MKNLCTYIDSKNRTARAKYRIVLLITGLLSALTGLAAWLIVRTWMFSTLGGLICFVGYPFIVTWYLTIIYLFRNALHDGAVRETETHAHSSSCSTPAHRLAR